MSTSRVTMWRSYFESSALLQTALDERFRAESQLTLVEYHLLLLLDEAPGRQLRMGDLARGMVFSSSRLNYQIGLLEKRGLVRRERDAGDARVVQACLTAAGKKKFDQAGRWHLMAVRELFLDRLSNDEVDVLDRVFSTLRDDLRNVEE